MIKFPAGEAEVYSWDSQLRSEVDTETFTEGGSAMTFVWAVSCFHTPLKSKMEPENRLVEEHCLPKFDVQVPCRSLPGQSYV